MNEARPAKRGRCQAFAGTRSRALRRSAGGRRPAEIFSGRSRYRPPRLRSAVGCVEGRFARTNSNGRLRDARFAGSSGQVVGKWRRLGSTFRPKPHDEADSRKSRNLPGKQWKIWKPVLKKWPSDSRQDQSLAATPPGRRTSAASATRRYPRALVGDASIRLVVATAQIQHLRHARPRQEDHRRTENAATCERGVKGTALRRDP